MPRASKAEAVVVMESEVLTSRHAELDDFTVVFEEYHVDADGSPVFRGLPDDRCQSPHWGYVVRGRVTFRFADREESYRAGDAYYAPPGHIPVVTAGTEVVEFSPAAEYRLTQEAIARNMAAAGAV